jgi:thymidylate synthase
MIKDDPEWARIWGELGPIYGKQWRGWFMYNDSVEPVFRDQIKELVRGLKLNPNSRRHIVSAWNVGDLDDMTLPPCHYGFQCYVVNGTLSLMWNQRSVDTFLGLPFNIASYATLLLLLCEETGYEAGELIANLGDVHLYKNHVEQAWEQLGREAYSLPSLKLSNVSLLDGEFDYELIDYKHHPRIKAPLSN